jgi:molecular chaperone DnaK
MTKLIEKNTTIPTRANQTFSTADDNQTAVTIHVLQGEREQARHNKSLGRFDLSDLPPAPRGMPQVEVTFDIDANGILNVSAKDLGTGKEQKIEIKGGSGLDESEVEQMIEDAESHAEEDRAQRELAEARNIGENAAYQAEKQLEELGDKVDDSNKQQIESAIKDVRDSLTSEDAGEIRSKTDALQSAFQQVSQQIYEAAAQEQAAAGDGDGDAPSANGGPADSEEEVIDAEVVEDDETSKK